MDAVEYLKTRKLMCNSMECHSCPFNDLVGCEKWFTENNNPEEAVGFVEAWKKQKEEINVGDEVYKENGVYVYGVVTFIEKRKTDELCYHTVGSDGHVWCLSDKDTKKTGRHFPEVAKLLNKIHAKENN